MNELSIIIGNDIKTSHASELVSTSFFLKFNSFCFPDEQWTDFAYPLVSIWAETLRKQQYVQNSSFELMFMDGPYKLQCAKNGNLISINCITFRHRSTSTLTLACTYGQLIDALLSASKSLSFSLYAMEPHLYTSNPIYQATLETIKSLRTLKQRISDKK